ncbi:hypothetical protein [Pseudoflavonifractor sp. An85]|uniref:hypothetical protein n=1 Tax=Pseudoflavonifractor sp. An85 TaxID=1965661 RepID=UPI000B37457E|nr:hypothetical protein [Pseudoflavonifractor sp. An85]OUN22774.1 hypothetical protein B5G37_09555 [Pseudoflavonifractor sp. An85]
MPRTREAQQRYNIKLSYKKLVALLETNFPDGVCVITLDYWREYPAPGEKLATEQHRAWHRMLKGMAGGKLAHIHAMGRNEQGDGYPIHRVITALQEDFAEFAADYWDYGNTQVETVPREGLEALAGLIMQDALERGCVREFGKHTWDSSGLVR